ncbi:Uncharacterised protein [Mycobacteroides abscessus subsp. abscessus]|nr:Uncharacterised protein [Mycobacteroides abscessus subsp. abscessus]
MVGVAAIATTVNDVVGFYECSDYGGLFAEEVDAGVCEPLVVIVGHVAR